MYKITKMYAGTTHLLQVNKQAAKHNHFSRVRGAFLSKFVSNRLHDIKRGRVCRYNTRSNDRFLQTYKRLRRVRRLLRVLHRNVPREERRRQEIV